MKQMHSYHAVSYFFYSCIKEPFMWFLLSVVAGKHLHCDSYPRSWPLGFPL